MEDTVSKITKNSSLIYPEIRECHNFENILLIDDTVPSYQYLLIQ